MQLFSYFLLLVYSCSILLIFFYGLAQFNLLLNYLKSKKQKDCSEKFNFNYPEEIPLVTIQLPIFNEKYVVERLLSSISNLEYPREKLEVQLLDDSTDDSVLETKKLVRELQKTGLNIQYIFRKNRVGYKAGALKEGLEIAKGEFIAIFDADFLPEKDWLFQTIPHFKNDEIGVVQTRWGHLNRDYSILTKIQAFALDAHFTLEQAGRNSKGHFINFNGTAGVWRKKCIYDAGNWESDTLTEDLDLSYRAQLKGWKFKYLEHVETPAELPIILSAARSQQFRWNKGGAENFRKMNGRVISSSKIPFKTKVHGILHLLNSSMFLMILVMSVLSVPVLIIKQKFHNTAILFDFLLFFVITTILFFISYWIVFKTIRGGDFKNFVQYIGLFLTFYTVAMGFSYQNSIAVLEGYFGKKSEFVRTPKFNINHKNKWKDNIYISRKISKNTIVEGLLVLYFAFGLYLGLYLRDFALFPFHLMLVFGFGFVFFRSIVETK